jgi:NTP pyrophosphatase (non-canonical NTP hydrolase)
MISTVEIKKFIDKEHLRLLKLSSSSEDADKRSLSRCVKLTEEVGELSEAVLHTMKDQRKEKLTDEKNVAHEIADVMIVGMLIAKNMDIDVFGALEEKINIIKNRKY